MRARIHCLVLATSLLSLWGCDSRSISLAADSGPGRPDVGGAGDGGGGPTVWRFFAEDDGGAPQAVALKLDSLAGDQATLNVVLRGVDALQGVAFRVRFDPQQVQVTKTEVGSAWTASGAEVVSRLVTQPEGEVWAGIGHAGSHGFSAAQEVVVARLQVKLQGGSKSPLSFRPQHNLVLDPEAQPVAVSWLGGEFRRVAP
jgi:hypothetical protein